MAGRHGRPGQEAILWGVDGATLWISAGPDLAVVDLLARLELAARAHGCTLRVVDSPRLRELLELVGLDDEIGGCSGLQSGREAEQREQPRCVEEEVEATDDPA